MTKNRALTALLLFLFSVTLVANLTVLVNNHSRDLIRVRKDIGTTGLWRSASFNYANRFADFVLFLNETIPPDAHVLLPPRDNGPLPLTLTPYMQYFLYPREISNCVGDFVTCASRSLDSDVYILTSTPAAFPGPLVQEMPGRYLSFDPEFGVFVPASYPGPSGEVSPHFSSILEIGIAALWPILFLSGLALAGALILYRWLPGDDFNLRFAAGFGLGIGWLSFTLFGAMLLGAPLTPGVIFFSYALWLTLALFITFAVKPRVWSFPTPSFDPWVFLILVFVGLASILSWGKGYSATDELVVWGPKGYGIAAQGLSEGASNWGTVPSHHPLNLPILIATFRTIFTERLPESKLISPFFYLALSLGAYGLLRRQLPRNLAGLSTLTIATTPLIFEHATIAYANLPAAFYFFVGATIHSQLVSGDPAEGSSSKTLIGSIFITLAAWTRPEVLLIAWIAFAILALFILRNSSSGFPRGQIAALITPLLLFTIVWQAAIPVVYTRQSITSGIIGPALKELLQGNVNLEDAKLVISFFFKNILNLETYGAMGWLTIALILLLLVRNQWKVFTKPAILIALVYLAAILGSYYLTGYQIATNTPLTWWLGTGLMRMILPGVILFWVGLLPDSLPGNDEGSP